ncbi:hypothetical protein ONZ45_g16195 [Pleurotus djamor]|nr:hypothetical protein ONZ45_g16195 [Pleurotus djamor]
MLTDWASQRRIDDQISELHQTIRDLKIRRNSCNAISQLPNELLSRVFLQVRYPYHPRTLVEGGSRGQWMSILGVCHSWRMVALATPHLWNWIDMGFIEQARQFIERSKTLPLNVQYICEPYDDPTMTVFDAEVGFLDKAGKAIMPHIERFQSLEACAFNSESLMTLLENIKPDSAAPLLETLDLCLRSPGVMFLVPADNLPKRMDSLRYCVFDNGNIASALPFLPRLQFLQFGADAAPIKMVLESLANTPNLEELIINPADIDFDVDPSSLAPVPLKKLTSISVVSLSPGVDSHSTKLFDLLEYPCCERIAFRCKFLEDDSPPFESLERVFSHVANFGTGASGILDIEYNNDESMLELCYMSKAQILIELPLLHSHYDAWDSLLHALPLASVASLSLRAVDEGWLEHVNFFSRLDAVQTLTLDGTSDTFVRSLLKSNDDGPSLLPHLRSLTFVNHTFCTYKGTLRKGFYEAVKDFLAERKALGIQIGVLDIPSSEFTETIDKGYGGLVDSIVFS